MINRTLRMETNISEKLQFCRNSKKVNFIQDVYLSIILTYIRDGKGLLRIV